MSNSDAVIAELGRMNKLLGLVAIKDMETADAIKFLRRAGLTNTEIGDLVEKTANAVKLVLLRDRRRSKVTRKT